MKKRIFITINLPEDIRSKLVGYQEKWPEIPARWTKPENLHITLVFIGDVEEQEISEIKQTVQNVIVPVCRPVRRSPKGEGGSLGGGGRHKSFSVNLTKICYAPPKITPPRMIWAEGEKSEEFDSLCDKLGKALVGLPKIRFRPENRESIPHITLARIKEWEWRRIEPDERPEIGEDINLSFEVKSIELMESQLKRGGPEYTIIESYPL